MINEKFILLGVLLNILGSGSYALSTIKGKTQPNRVTWFLWAFAPLIAFSAQLGEGVGWESILTFMAGFGPLLVFTSSFVNRKSYWRISKLDIFCGVISVFALILWWLSGSGLIAILFSILADLIAAIPTIIKSFKAPETEHSAPFLYSSIAATITLLTISSWQLVNYAFALYILVVCVVLYIIIQFKIGPKYFLKVSND